MNKYIIISAISIVASTASLMSSAKPLLDYDFNNEITHYKNLGTLNAPLEGVGINQKAGEPGSGVSGTQGDRAWDSSDNATQGVQVPSNDSALMTEANHLDLASLDAFTLSFWYKTEHSLDQDAATRFFMKADRHASEVLQGLVLRSYKGGLELRIGAVNSNIERETIVVSSRDFAEGVGYNRQDEWVFVALTWDGNHVLYYVADAKKPIGYAGGGPFSGRILDHPSELYIGNSRSLRRGLDGWVDNFRFFDTAISSSEIEALRRKDLSGD